MRTLNLHTNLLSFSAMSCDLSWSVATNEQGLAMPCADKNDVIFGGRYNTQEHKTQNRIRGSEEII